MDTKWVHFSAEVACVIDVWAIPQMQKIVLFLPGCHKWVLQRRGCVRDCCVIAVLIAVLAIPNMYF